MVTWFKIKQIILSLLTIVIDVLFLIESYTIINTSTSLVRLFHITMCFQGLSNLYLNNCIKTSVKSIPMCFNECYKTHIDGINLIKSIKKWMVSTMSSSVLMEVIVIPLLFSITCFSIRGSILKNIFFYIVIVIFTTINIKTIKIFVDTYEKIKTVEIRCNNYEKE